MTRLPAITIWQPWASLIAAGAKPYEFRGWAAPKPYRGRRIAIHAGARPVRMTELRALRLQLRDPDNATGLRPEIALPLLEDWCLRPGVLPLASIVCTAVLGEPRRACDLPEFAHRFVNDSNRAEHANFGWPLAEVVRLEPPLPYRGAQGFWPCELDGVGA